MWETGQSIRGRSRDKNVTYENKNTLNFDVFVQNTRSIIKVLDQDDVRLYRSLPISFARWRSVNLPPISGDD